MEKVKPELLEELAPIDFSVLPDDMVLVLIYREQGNDVRFLKLLHENEFIIRVLSENGTGRHIIEIEFIKTNDVVRMVFNRTEADYPLKRYANTGIIQRLSTGIIGSQGKVYWQQNFKEIQIIMGGIQNN